MSKLNTISENSESTVLSEYVSTMKRNGSYQSEDTLEKEFISILCEQGYEYISFSSEEEMVINLRTQLEKLNDYVFSDDEWDELFNKWIANQNNGIKEKAEIIQRDNRYTITTKDGMSKNITILDKSNVHRNSLQVLNQFENEGSYSNRYDVTILVNGLPLVHIELKRRGVNLKDAFNQIKRYQRESFWSGSGLFEYVQLFVISNGTFTKYYSNSVRSKHLSGSKSDTFEFTNYWADAENNRINDLVDFTKTFFARHSLLNILCKYCVYTTDGDLLVMRPYQIVATERIMNKVEMSHNYKNYGSVKSGGFIWHTTGSGKTLTSFKTATLCTKKEYIDKVLFIVDRKDLDYQTMKEYDSFEKDSANSNSSTKVLTKQLSDSNTKIIITTIQKLDMFIKKNKGHEIFNKEIVMIFDECHRSQFGDMHKNIIKNFKKYYIFGFTGTPIFSENVSAGSSLQTTEMLFGDKLHTYTIVDAIHDQNVLKFKFDYVKTMDARDNLKDEVVEAINTAEAFVSPIRINNIVKYIIDRYDSKTKRKERYMYKAIDNVVEMAKSNKTIEKKVDKSLSGFNSMLACSGIDSAKLYYNEFKRQDHDLNIAIIFSYAANEEVQDGLFDENNENINNLDKSSREFLDSAITDYNEMFGTSYDTSSEKFQNYYKDVSMRVKNREIDLLIVANMFLTGFDAKTLNTLWVDKNLKYHGLIQAFSRTNRILNDVKSHGNIVSFRNIEDNLNDALKLFGDRESSGTILMKTYDEYYNGYGDAKEKFVGYLALINRIKEEYPLPFTEIKGEESQKEFVRLYGAILRVRNILSTFDEFDNDNIISDLDLADYQSVYLNLRNQFRSESETQQESIVDDLVFEMELIKQIEVNIDYILELIAKYNTGNSDAEILVKIRSMINSSPNLRNKKDLIEMFIASLTPTSNIIEEFNTFISGKREAELDELIASEKLNKEETYKYVEEMFEYGEVNIKGPVLNPILPHMSMFTPDNERTRKKEVVIYKLTEFFERFYSISE